MRLLKRLLGLVAAVLAHVVLVWTVPESARAVDLFLIVTVLAALDGRTAVALLTGTAAGLSRDTFSGGLFGLHGIADTVVGYLVARTAQRLDLDNLPAVALATTLATLVQKAILVGLAVAFMGGTEGPQPVWVLVEAGVNGLVAGILYAVGGRARRLKSAAERRRMSRLRL